MRFYPTCLPKNRKVIVSVEILNVESMVIDPDTGRPICL